MMKIGPHEFEGPFTTTEPLEDRSGVYIILCKTGDDYIVIDVGESAQVKTRVSTHDRTDCWDKNCSGELNVAVLYTPNAQQIGRMAIEQALRTQYSPACGAR